MKIGAIIPGITPRPDQAADDAAGDPWRVLQNPAADRDAVCHAWLHTQARVIAGVQAAVLVLRQPDGSATPASVWPPTRDSSDLVRLAERAITEQRMVVAWTRLDPRAPRTPLALFLAQPLGREEQPYGAAAVAVALPEGIGRADPAAIARQLRGGSGWLETLFWRQSVEDAQAGLARAVAGMDLVAVMGEHPRLAAASMAVVNEMALSLRCDRVTIGLCRGRMIKLQAVSHSANFLRTSRVADTIEEAMDEALIQNGTVVFPLIDGTADPPRSRRVNVAHRDLAAANSGPAAAASVVLPGPGGVPIGVITLERHRDDPFDVRTLLLAETLGTLVGPMVGLHVRANRWVAGRVVDSVEDGLRAVFGAGHPSLKLALVVTAALVLVLSVADGTHRVGARSILEGEIQRAAVAPFDGYIRSAAVRAGDRVHAGDVLAMLEDKDLILERMKAWAEREKLIQKHRDALAKHDRSLTAALEAEIPQVQAQLTLAEENLARVRLTAPFDGIVVSGDLSQMLGSPIEKGKALFEIAPLDAYRLVIQVDERDIRWIEPTQTGMLALASMPGRRLAFTVTRIMPVSTAEEGHNFFRVEAKLEPADDIELRPGMEGIAKIDAGTRGLLWIWGHSLADWIRLTAWKFLP